MTRKRTTTTRPAGYAAATAALLSPAGDEAAAREQLEQAVRAYSDAVARVVREAKRAGDDEAALLSRRADELRARADKAAAAELERRQARIAMIAAADALARVLAGLPAK